MPWRQFGFKRIVTSYKKVIEEILKNKSENVQLAQDELWVRGEIMKRDFTKRQMNILALIMVLSYYIGKNYAIIPKMRDWEMAGISKIIARKELTKLVELNVLDWVETENRFHIKDPKEWLVTYNAGYNDIRSQELFALNLKDVGIYIEPEK